MKNTDTYNNNIIRLHGKWNILFKKFDIMRTSKGTDLTFQNLNKIYTGKTNLEINSYKVEL